MNYNALLKKFIELLNTQSESIPPEAWAALFHLEAELVNKTMTTPASIAKAVIAWTSPYPTIKRILRTSLGERANLPEEDENDDITPTDDAQIITNETLRRAIQSAQAQYQAKSNPDN